MGFDDSRPSAVRMGRRSRTYFKTTFRRLDTGTPSNTRRGWIVVSIDFDSLLQKRTPTRKEAALYRRWVTYLKDSKLSEDEIHRRASQFTAQRRNPTAEEGEG